MRMRSLALAGLLAAGLMLPATPSLAQSVLRVAPHSDLKIIDPIWTTALISTNHGFLVYDTLFALDEKLEVKPQMVETATLSDDKLTWTFKLRDGLAWHDGAPVTAEDCIASIKRWAARDSMGQKMMAFTAALEAPDAKTIVIKLKEPYGLVLYSLAKVSANVAFMMPKRVAETSPTEQITDATGSGPFIFKKDEWKPGEKIVYVKNASYKPRAEPASGTAGGKVAKVDRVEWIWISDWQTAADALMKGDVDIVEALPHDLLPLVQKDPNVSLVLYATVGRQFALRFNTLHKPFDNPKVRQAVAYALNQKDFLEATIGDAKWYAECKAMFVCGSPLETVKGWDDKLGSNFTKARALLAEAGYDGTPVVIMQSTDIPTLTNMAPVAKSLMEKAGFKVDMQSMDWQTLVARRTKKDAPSAGGWHAFLTSWGSVDVLNPVATSFLNASCETANFGWPCDAELEKLRDAYAREPDGAKQKLIAEAVQVRAAEYPTHIHLGQFMQPAALRKNITGMLVSHNIVYWNIEKK